MTFEEFKTVAITLKAAFPALKAFDTDEGIRTWYEMLKDLEYKIASEAVAVYIRESPYPPAVADIRNTSRRVTVPDWSVEWHKLLRKAKLSELNTPAQYALQTMTEEYVREMMDSNEKITLCMKDFERLYQNYFKLTGQDKKALQSMGLWEKEQTGRIEMQQRMLPMKDGRVPQ